MTDHAPKGGRGLKARPRKQTMSGRQIWAEARRLTGVDNIASTSAAFLLASALVGASAEKVRRRLQMTRADARSLAKKARASGIWVGRRIAGAEWFEKDGGLSLVMDAMVLDGLLERAR